MAEESRSVAGGGAVGRIFEMLRAAPAFLSRRFSYFTDLKRVYALMPPGLRARLWLIASLQFVRSLLESSSIFVIAMMTQSVSAPESLRQTRVFRSVLPLLPGGLATRLDDDRTLIIAMCVLVVAFIILKNFVVFVTQAYSISFSERLGLFIGRRAFASYFAKGYLWLISNKGKALIPRIEQRAHLTSLVNSIVQILGNALCALIMFAVLFAVNARLTLTVIAVFGLVCAGSYALLRREIDARGKELGEINSRQGWAVRMAQRGIREILIYRKQDVFLEAIVKNIREAIPAKTFIGLSGSIPGWILEVAGFIIIFAAMVDMVARDVPVAAIVPAMSLLLLSAWRLLPMISRSMGLAVHIRSIRARALSCLELLEDLDDAEDPRRPAAGPNLAVTRSIALDKVSFTYPDGKRPSLDGISLAIRRGESIGLVGHSGAGKSTLGMILAGLFPATSGRLLVDDREVGEAELHSYRGMVGFVPQSPLLLPGSIADNIALAHWGQEPDRAKIQKAGELAAMTFLAGKRGGLDFAIGDTGEGLSGGEAQRVSIARALYTDPDILVLDEATSSLDRNSELAIESTVKAMRGRVTSVIIAHRLSTIEQCDRVVWLEAGRIRQIGAPAEVLGQYAKSRIVP